MVVITQNNYNYSEYETEFNYWHAESFDLISINVYSNDDILMTYSSIFINGPQTQTQDHLSISALVRIDHTNGITLWAKELYYIEDFLFYDVMVTSVVNNIAWNLLTAESSYLNIPGIIIKVDENGKAIEGFILLNNYSFLNSFFNNFKVHNALFMEDSSFIIMAKWAYYQGEFGVSDTSVRDFWYFKFNSNRDFEWGTSIDYGNDYEENYSFGEHNNILFISQVSKRYYHCLEAIDIQSGAVLRNNCLYFDKFKYISNYRYYFMSLITDEYVFAFTKIPDRELYTDGNALVMYDYNTLKVLRIYKNYTCTRFLGFWNSQLKKYGMYWFYNRMLFTLYPNELGELVVFNSTINTNFLDDYPVTYFLKRTSNDIYYLSVLINNLDATESISSNVPLCRNYILKLNSNLASDSWITFSDKAEADSNFIVPFDYTAENSTIRLADIELNVFTTYTSSIYNKSASVINFNFIDVTEWIWPRYDNNATTWNYPLPDFILDKNYIIQIGSGISNKLSYTPFVHWQNSLFIITAYDNKTETIPEWMSVNQIKKTIEFDLTKLNSVGDYYLLLNARLATYSINNTEESKYTTPNFYTKFSFLNTNWYLSSSNSTNYLVINNMSIFVFKFVDAENDRTILKVNNINKISTFITQPDVNKNEISLYLQTSIALDTTVKISNETEHIELV